MSRRARRAAATPVSPDEHLTILGLRRGERVRWRRGASGRWLYGTVRARELDGSIAVTEEGGAARSITVERLDVQAQGPRGAQRWEPVTVRASRAEQLTFDLYL